MFLWRNFDPRTLASVLDWIATRDSAPARPTASASRPAPAESRPEPRHRAVPGDTKPR